MATVEEKVKKYSAAKRIKPPKSKMQKEFKRAKKLKAVTKLCANDRKPWGCFYLPKANKNSF